MYFNTGLLSLIVIRLTWTPFQIVNICTITPSANKWLNFPSCNHLCYKMDFLSAKWAGLQSYFRIFFPEYSMNILCYMHCHSETLGNFRPIQVTGKILWWIGVLILCKLHRNTDSGCINQQTALHKVRTSTQNWQFLPYQYHCTVISAFECLHDDNIFTCQ